MNEPNCPKCQSENTYSDGLLLICPECGHEWALETSEGSAQIEAEPSLVKDAHGHVLTNGDSIIVIKDLKVKGSSSSLKAGTKVKNIRIIDEENGHNISCKVDGFGSMNLKSEFVKKA